MKNPKNTRIELEPKRSELIQKSSVIIGAGSLGQIADLCDFGSYTKLFVVTDETVAPLWLDTLLQALPERADYLVLPAGEQAKQIGSVQAVWTALKDAGCDRKSLIINLGGGVVCDMGGFAASTYMRGVDFIHVPTTLLSQVDASVGGKTGIDFAGLKNLIGTFNQPRVVIIDPDILATLQKREFVAGFGEIIKHGLITSDAYLRKVTAKLPNEFSSDELADIIAESCRIKANVVKTDVAEAGMRQVLNFGHTVGHAIESFSLETDTPLLHGEAVAIGMVVEADISRRLSLLDTKTATQIQSAVAKSSLPASVPRFPVGQLLKRMDTDKKNRAGSIRFTLLEDIGRPVYGRVVDKGTIESALRSCM